MTALPPRAFFAQGTMGLHVQAAMAQFGTSRLSDREAKVARLILLGTARRPSRGCWATARKP
jgi:hypothetical protein